MNEHEWNDRLQEILEALTLEEKLGMIHGAELFQTKGVPRLGIPPLVMSDGPMGVRQEFLPASWQAAGLSDDYVTYIPCNSALAATWNRRLAREMGSVLGEEARGRGKDIILAPGINLKRSPLCGRNFEYFSEDPYLTKELAVPFIQGVQRWDVASCVKHFAANNQETERLWVDVRAEEETLEELYFPAFYDAVKKGGSYAVMGAYNLLNGEHCCQSEYLLNHVLRKKWGYDGVVVSDWGAVHDTKMAAESQLDIEMSVTDDFDQYHMAEPLKRMVEKGEISEQVIDEKVRHILLLMDRLHMLGGERKRGAYNTPEHREAALQTARESVVLLKNERNKLPLSAEETKRVLVVGENGSCMHAGGGGSAEIKALYEITPLMGIKKLLGGGASVRFVPGYVREEETADTGANWQETSLENGGGSVKKKAEDQTAAARRRELREEAVRLAAQYEQVIFVGGLNHEYDSEGNDRADMKLPYEQDLLIRELLEVNPETIVVLLGGSPVEMGEWIHQAGAVVWSWYAGMEGGTALAEVLFGAVNPSGKLPETFYKTHTDCSAHALGEFPGGQAVHYREGVFVGYRYQDTFGIEPQFCFGHGLSYTTFAYRNPSVSEEGGCARVACEITNTGSREGCETVQVYLAPKQDGKKRPAQELKGFEKIRLLPGETQRISILLDEPARGSEIRIGSSSRDIRLILRREENGR